MIIATHITLEEYLKTIYEPDADYIDGEIEERNVGEYDHNTVLMALCYGFTGTQSNETSALSRNSAPA